MSSTFNVTPQDLVLLKDCLCSKACVRMFKILFANRDLNVSAISRKAGCNNGRCIEYLKKLVKLGIVGEEFYAGRHSFTLKKIEFTDLMQQAISLMDEDEG